MVLGGPDAERGSDGHRADPAGTLVASPDVRHPVPFARELLALDDISDGRFTLRVGSGGDGKGGYDSTVLGDPEPTSAQLSSHFAEFLELLDALLTTHSVHYHRVHYEALGARNVPGCVQRPEGVYGGHESILETLVAEVLPEL